MSVLAQRNASLEALERTQFDALVVGGGIVGTGIARDLALRGLKVALVEKNDLASGTSSRPTRLIHGGLRYLEMFDFGLVRTDMREREVLLHLAPHLVQPLQFLMPMYGRGVLYRAKLQAGMQLYDALSFDKSLPTRQWLNKRQLLRVEPGLSPTALQGAWQFYDGQLSLVERLVVENALDAAQHEAVVATCAHVVEFLRDDLGGVVGARVQDRLSGQSLDVRARLTVNATGPWLDLTTQTLRPGRRPLLRLTKGVHLVTPSATRKAHVLFAQKDGRLFFVIPWLGYSLVGTTDTDYVGDPADAAATDEDVEYLVSEARSVFPDGQFDQIYYAYAGVRALVRIEHVAEGKVSRKHALYDHARRDGVPGLVSVVGGKITGYRAIAEEVGDLVARKLRWPRRELPTDAEPLPGGHLRDLETYVIDEVWPRAAAFGLDREQAEHLGSMYGSMTPAVLARIERNPRLAERVCPNEPTIAAQLEHAVESEWALSLGDVLLRRTALGLRACQALDCLDTVVERVAPLLGWDTAERASQVEAYRRELAPMRRFSREPATV
ncbi:MAG: glycerol-3-phosphate dehydrogenase [Chloroflexi bacterium]|nr:glycerol-3-phosphate dehydrogenase [Chloroflexota bacterium]MBV9133355.1 glycerol-3-phosphate dehydrogenase [Chloroflexota bacterium]MBV9895837.1 glycerol-3-phosphate dehydrogenase [Chloroflexota bacterium]